jgi:hypothetical protein
MIYLTIEDKIRANGHRHLERAISYACAEYPDHYYEGSMRKARKNFKIADSFTETDKLMQLFLKNIAEDLNNHISNHILYGTGYSKINDDGTVTSLKTKDIYK